MEMTRWTRIVVRHIAGDTRSACRWKRGGSAIHREVVALLAILAIVMTGTVVAQILPRGTTASSIVTDPPGAEIWRGDTLLGMSPMELVTGTGDTIDVWWPSRAEWNAVRHRISRTLVGADDGVVHLRLPVQRFVNSTPSGALVFAGDSLLGRTPLRLALTEDRMGLRIAMPRCCDTLVEVTRSGDGSVVIDFPREAGPLQRAQDIPAELRWPPMEITLPGSVALAAGIAAAVLKLEADRSYARYRETGDGALLDRARRFDTASGVGLAILEIGVGWLIWHILVEPVARDPGP